MPDAQPARRRSWAARILPARRARVVALLGTGVAFGASAGALLAPAAVDATSTPASVVAPSTASDPWTTRTVAPVPGLAPSGGAVTSTHGS
jgi:hypothetical protein